MRPAELLRAQRASTTTRRGARAALDGDRADGGRGVIGSKLERDEALAPSWLELMVGKAADKKLAGG